MAKPAQTKKPKTKTATMSNNLDSMPLNITLSMGGVNFHLTTFEDPSDDYLTSPEDLPATPRTAVRRRRAQRIRRQSDYFDGNSATGYKNTSLTEPDAPIISIRRGQTQQQPGRENGSRPRPQSPMHQHILGRVRAMKEKIEVEERRKSLPSPTHETKLKSAHDKSSEPRVSPSSGYFVDLHSFTGTLQITPNMITKFGDNTSTDEQASNNVKQELQLESPKKRRRNTALKASKKKSFTWIASNDCEVETGSVGVNDQTSSCSQNQIPSLARNGVPFTPSKKFDFVDAVSDSENEPNEEDVETGNEKKLVRFSFGAETLNQHGFVDSQASLQVKSDSSVKLGAPQSNLSLNEEVKQEETSRSLQNERPRMSFTSPPKLLHSLARSSRQAMAQIGLGGNAYDQLGSDSAINPNGSLRSWDAVAGIGYNDVEGTELHRVCASMDLTNIRSVLQRSNASDVMAIDSQGRYPIHVFAENHDLITEHPEECEEIVEMLFLQLMGGPDKFVQALHPASGRGPFVSIIGSWVDDLHNEVCNRQNGSIPPNSPSGIALAPGTTPPRTRTRKTFTNLHRFGAADRNERVLSSVFMLDQEKAFFLPYSVYMNDHVKWAIKILSSLIDMYPQQTREAILTNITSTVPLFLKCVFLLNDADDLASLAESSLVKHTIIDKRSINLWLVAMLTSPTRDTKMRAVSYLKLLSRLTLTDLAATSQYRERYSDEEIERFVRLRTEAFDTLYSMPGIFPAVLGLGGKEKEALSTTRVMRYITDRTIRKDSQFFKLICDFFFGIFLLMGFRLQIEFVFSYDHRDGPPGYSDRSFWSMSTYAIAFYFLIKDSLSILSLYLTSTKLAKRYCTSVFNIIDLLAVLIIIGEGGPIGDDDINMYNGWAACLVTILLWLKVMGAFKVLNQSFALFMYAVWEVIKEIKWFIVFLFAVTVMFSDAARAAVAVTGDCDNEPYASSDFCSGGYFTIVRMYSVLVGDVELDYFGKMDLMIGVFFFFSLFCIIILLNIMIAIIIDSYERTNQRSREIFGRAQVEYAAALVARKQFIRPKEVSEFHVAAFVPHALRKFLRLIYSIASTGALVFFEYGYAGAIIYIKEPDQNEFAATINNLILVYIIVGSVFNAYIFSFALIALFGWCEPSNPSSRSKCYYILKRIMRVLEMAVNLFHRVMFSHERLRQLDLSEDVIDHSALYKSTLAPPAANTR